jgi:hypothetical protein
MAALGAKYMLWNWFWPRTCPISEAKRIWIEDRWLWLCQIFGTESIRSATVVLPTYDFFPDPFNHSGADARIMFERLCGYLSINSDEIELVLYEDRNPHLQEKSFAVFQQLPTGESHKYRIGVEVANLEIPLALIAVLARELGRIRLIEEVSFPLEMEEEERLIDILTVFLGLGVIGANGAVIDKTFDYGHGSRWTMARRSHLTLAEYGFALALFAKHRPSDNCVWANELRPDTRSTFRQSLRYLEDAGISPSASG